jgi:hypothetical protein
MRLLRVLPLLALAFLPACATITTGTDHTMAVVTDPAGASCELRRGGDLVGVINRTPATVRFGKSYRDIAIDCAHPNAGRGTTTVSAGFQPMFLGNILLGGVIGMGVDIISAAGADYPSTAYVTIRAGDGAPSPAAPSAPASPAVASLAREAVSAPAIPSASLQDHVAAARAACQRARRGNCDAAAEAAGAQWEREWQERRANGRT